MSTEIDWSKAPEGFPIWCESIGNSSPDYSGWHRQNDSGDYVDQSGWIWSKRAEGSHFQVYRRPEPWSGEGLPPVGTVCEYKHTDADEWVKIRVLGYDGEHIWCRALGSERSMVIVSYSALRKSVDDILPEEEERELAIRQMMIDCDNAHARGVLEDLYDSGYRKVPQ